MIIGKRIRNLSTTDPIQCIAGYCSGSDMTTRGPEERSLRNSIDSYSVLGPWMVTADELTNPHSLDYSLSVNGEARQCANTRDLVIGIADLLVFASSFYTLEPGDILFIGTREGAHKGALSSMRFANVRGHVREREIRRFHPRQDKPTARAHREKVVYPSYARRSA